MPQRNWIVHLTLSLESILNAVIETNFQGQLKYKRKHTKTSSSKKAKERTKA